MRLKFTKPLPQAEVGISNRVLLREIDSPKDMGFAEEKDGKIYNMPGFSVFKKEDGNIFRTAKDQFGPGDFYMPLWHFFDVLPNGVNGFQPK